MRLDASKPIKSVNFNGMDAPLDILNIAYGITPPSDVTRLWVPLEKKPDNVEISGDSLQSAVDTIETKMAVLNSAMALGAAVSINGKVYYFGGYGSSGFNTVQEYDPSTDTIITKSATFAEKICRTSAVAINGKAYIFGGGLSSSGAYHKTIQEYDPASDTLTTKNAAFDGNRSETSAVAINGKAYIFGGNTSGSSQLSARTEIYEYDPVLDTLTLKSAKLPEARCDTSAVAINGKAYIFGGRNGGGSNTQAIFEYDPVADSVKTMSTTIDKTCYRTSAVAINGKAYVFGVTGYSEPATIYEYDPVANTIKAMTSVLSQGAMGTNATLVEDTVYVLGGQISAGAYTDAIQAYTPKAYLGANHLKIFASVYRGEEYQLVTNIVKNNTVTVKLYMTSAFIGDEEGYAKSQDAYVFNKNTQQWQKLDGTSMTTDMLNALAELGVT